MATKTAKLNREQRDYLLNKMKAAVAARLPDYPKRPEFTKSFVVMLPVEVEGVHCDGDSFYYTVVRKGRNDAIKAALPEAYKQARAKYDAELKVYQAAKKKGDEIINKFAEELIFANSDVTALNKRMDALLSQLK